MIITNLSLILGYATVPFVIDLNHEISRFKMNTSS